MFDEQETNGRITETQVLRKATDGQFTVFINTGTYGTNISSVRILRVGVGG